MLGAFCGRHEVVSLHPKHWTSSPAELPHIVPNLLVLCHSAGGSSIGGWWSVPVSSPAPALAHACMHLPHTAVAVQSVFYSNLKLCFISPQQELQLLLRHLDVSSTIFPLSPWLYTFCGFYKALFIIFYKALFFYFLPLHWLKKVDVHLAARKVRFWIFLKIIILFPYRNKGTVGHF